MSVGLNNLKHIIVLMLNGRSFDHMLGGLNHSDRRINGLAGNESNPDPTGALIPVQPLATFEGQFATDPATNFAAVDLQIFGEAFANQRIPNMQGFVKSYFQQRANVNSSHSVMYYFTPEKLPVLTTLATEFAVFNAWFSSVPGPTICNRAFAHYGTSFGNVGMNLFYATGSVPSIYERLIWAGHSAKIYYYDLQSSSLGTINIVKNHPQLFATFNDFLVDCKNDRLPEYCFIEPNYVHHSRDDGTQALASDQHPGHNVQVGESFIASIYNAIHANANLWRSAALLILYDQHGGIFDHVAPPECVPDDYVANPDSTGTGESFSFNRLGVRVPAVLVSPYIPRATVVNDRFEHASIPKTAAEFFLSKNAQYTVRERHATSFLLALGDTLRSDDDVVVFEL